MSTIPALDPIADDLRRVEALLRARLESEVALVGQITNHVVAGGGKRLRPALVLLAADAGCYTGTSKYELAAAIELIHTATLLHDDVVDESYLRRGQSTANSAFGNAAAVLAGDFLYSRAFQIMVSVGDLKVMDILADATNTIAEGELLQLMNCRNPELSEQSCVEVIRRKTAKLFEASTWVGAVLAGMPPRIQGGLASYGMHLGTAFQLIDDVLDYSGDEESTGKSLGDDLAEGKPTLPLIYTIRTGTPAQAKLVRNAILEGGRNRFAEVLRAVNDVGALDYVRQVARGEAAEAERAIEHLDASKAKGILLELASFSVTRRH